jgi:hypothetical protein
MYIPEISGIYIRGVLIQDNFFTFNGCNVVCI